MRILLVDDDFSSISALANLLEYDNTLRIANNGVDAINMFEADRFDVVITDINMPQMNGIELLKRIRTVNAETPVIIITGHSTNTSESTADDMGVSGYFMKPLDVKSFMSTLAELDNEVTKARSDR